MEDPCAAKQRRCHLRADALICQTERAAEIVEIHSSQKQRAIFAKRSRHRSWYFQLQAATFFLTAVYTRPHTCFPQTAKDRPQLVGTRRDPLRVAGKNHYTPARNKLTCLQTEVSTECTLFNAKRHLFF